MKRAKKAKGRSQKYNVSEKQMQRIKQKLSRELTEKALLIFLAAAVDEIGLTDEQVCAIFKRANLYGGYLDDHIVKVKVVQETIEKGTGIKLVGW